jgi:hypothetical protein
MRRENSHVFDIQTKVWKIHPRHLLSGINWAHGMNIRRPLIMNHFIDGNGNMRQTNQKSLPNNKQIVCGCHHLCRIIVH